VSRPPALALLLLANVLWGTSYVATKVALEEIPPPLLGALRFSLASAVLWPALLWTARRARREDGAAPLLPPAGVGMKLALLGLLGISATALLGYWGIRLTTVTDAALMIVGEVIFTTLLAALIAREYIGRQRGVGILVGIAGVGILVAGGASEAGDGAGLARALGDALILAGLLLESLYTVLGAGLARAYRPLVVLTVAMTGSLAVWLPILAWHAASGQLTTLSPAALGGVLYLALVNSVGCYLIWFGVLRHAGATLGAISLLAQPLVGGLLGLAVLGDPFTPSLAVGGALILAALLLTALPGKAAA
jgi:drug/metabolite transporter (DMT)-like permease